MNVPLKLISSKYFIDVLINLGTQISPRDYREIVGDLIAEREIQTDIRMIHELAVPNYRDRNFRPLSTLSSRTESKYVQTEQTDDSSTASATQSSRRPTLSSQSSVDDDANTSPPNTPVDMNKLSRRVRRHVKPGCLLSVLPMNRYIHLDYFVLFISITISFITLSSDIIIIDPESNSIIILDKRGKHRYGISNSQFKEAYGKLDRGVRFQTPQGILTIKLENDLKLLADTSAKVYENLPETSA